MDQELSPVVPVVWTQWKSPEGKSYSFKFGTENGEFYKCQTFMNDEEIYERISGSIGSPKFKISCIPSFLPAPDKGRYSYLVKSDHFLGAVATLATFLPQWCHNNVENRSNVDLRGSLFSLHSMNDVGMERKVSFVKSADALIVSPLVLFEYILPKTMARNSLYVNRSFQASPCSTNSKQKKEPLFTKPYEVPSKQCPNRYKDFSIEKEIESLTKMTKACVEGSETDPDISMKRNEILIKFFAIEDAWLRGPKHESS